MKAIDIVQLLAANLPKYTDKFTTNVNVVSLARVGSTVTATTSAAHGLSVGSQVNIQGANTPITVTLLTRVAKVGTLITATDHDVTTNDNLRLNVELSGANEAEFNGSFVILGVANRREITFTMPDSGATVATGATLLDNGESYLNSYNGVQNVTTVATTTTFDYETTNTSLFTLPNGVISARGMPRVSAAINADRVYDAYTKQPAGELWAFVLLDDVVASKSREIDSDAIDNIQTGNEYRQQILQNFTILVMFPTSNQIGSRISRDEAEDLFKIICQSILSSEIDSGLSVGAQNPVNFALHGFAQSTTAYYAHAYEFTAVADITFGDTVGYPDDVAFRDIVLTQTLDVGTQEDPLLSTIDLDDQPL